MEYLFTFKPLEPWFFGEEKNFGFDNFKNENERIIKNNYFIKSGRMPSQSTIIGAIRYLILKKKNILSKNSVILDEDQKKYIGDTSFDLKKENQTFGKIKKIGPIHLYDGEEEYFRIPYCLKISNDVIQAYEMQKKGKRNNKEMLLPKNYNAKEGLVDGFISVSNGIHYKKSKDIFDGITKTRILKNSRNESDKREDAFFKKQYMYFKDEKWSFCCKVELEDDIDIDINKKDTVYMGQDKSLFVCVIEKKNTEINELEDKLKEIINISIEGYTTAISISDLYLTEAYEKFASYAIVKYKSFRYMASSHNVDKNDLQQTYYNRLKKSELFYLIESGSVFYISDDKIEEFKSLCDKKIGNTGFNTMIYLGKGKKK